MFTRELAGGEHTSGHRETAVGMAQGRLRARAGAVGRAFSAPSGKSPKTSSSCRLHLSGSLANPNYTENSLAFQCSLRAGLEVAELPPALWLPAPTCGSLALCPCACGHHPHCPRPFSGSVFQTLLVHHLLQEALSPNSLPNLSEAPLPIAASISTVYLLVV